MRYLLAIFALLSMTITALAQDPLPFPVTLAGQNAAMTEKSTVISFIANPVSSGAALAVKDVTGQVIVNIFPSDENGEVESQAQPMILLFDAGSTKAISANMQGTAPKAGWYAANVVAGGKTSRVCFQVK